MRLNLVAGAGRGHTYRPNPARCAPRQAAATSKLKASVSAGCKLTTSSRGAGKAVSSSGTAAPRTVEPRHVRSAQELLLPWRKRTTAVTALDIELHPP